MLIVHHLNDSRSQRILWMLEELGLDYEIRRYRRNSDMSAPKELMAIHPLGKSPILEDVSADGHRTVVVETGAICDYLVERANGRLGPGDATDTILYRQFLHYAEGSVMPVLLAMLVASKIPIMGRVASNAFSRCWTRISTSSKPSLPRESGSQANGSPRPTS